MQRILRGEFYYGWIIVGVTVLILMVSAGVRSAPGVMLLPMQAEMGWSRAIISFAISLGLILYGLVGPLSGFLIDRFGPRLLMIAGLLLIGASMVTSGMMNALWQLNLFWGAFSGIATGVIGVVLGATVANRWFHERRGLVIGIFGAATSAGQLIFLPLLMWLVVTIGWRSTVFILAGVAWVVLLPVLSLMRDDPADVGLKPYGAPEGAVVVPERAAASSVAEGAAEGNVMSRALRAPEFWLLSGTFFICGATSTGLIGTHLIPYAVDCGIPEVTAAGVLALMGAMNFVGTIGSGWLTDRYDPRKLLAIYYSFRGLALLMLPLVTNATGLAIFAIIFGLDYIATVPPTVTLVADTFGRKHVGVVFGWVFCAHQVGAALAAWMGGLTRDLAGDYAFAFLAAGILAVAAGMMALRIGRGLGAQPEPLAEAAA